MTKLEKCGKNLCLIFSSVCNRQLEADIFYLIISNVAVQVVDKNVDSKSVMIHFGVSTMTSKHFILSYLHSKMTLLSRDSLHS